MHELRAVTLSGYLEVAAAVGLDGYWMLRRAGIAPASLEDPDNRLPAAVVVRLLEQSAKRSGHDSFGLLMAERRSFASLGPISLLLDRLPDTRAVINALIAYRRHMNDIVTVDLEEGGDTALIKVGFIPEYAQVQATDFAVAIGYRVLIGASHGTWAPATVHLARQAPADLAPWWRFFQAPIEFGSLFNGFACPSASLDIAHPNADPIMARHAERLLQLVPLPREEAPVSERVRRAIASLLPNGQARLETVAAQLGVNRRALQRRRKTTVRLSPPCSGTFAVNWRKSISPGRNRSRPSPSSSVMPRRAPSPVGSRRSSAYRRKLGEMNARPNRKCHLRSGWCEVDEFCRDLQGTDSALVVVARHLRRIRQERKSPSASHLPLEFVERVRRDSTRRVGPDRPRPGQRAHMAKCRERQHRDTAEVYSG